MNKTFLKVAAVAAAALCALPMASALSANAKTGVLQRSNGRFGDVNGGGITGMDALNIQQYVNPSSANPANFNKLVADVNNDNHISYEDSIVIMRWLANPHYGDANDDGNVNAKDVRAIRNNNGVKNLIAADMNFDGVVNGVDANIIDNHIKGVYSGYSVSYGNVDNIEQYFGEEWYSKTISADLFRKCDVNCDLVIDEDDEDSIQRHQQGYGFTECWDY